MRSSGSGGKTVLLGEDDQEVRNYLEMVLKCQGYSVELAEDGEEVMDCLQSGQSNVSAVLLDIIMPRKDGLQALREIRRTDKNLPVIMISGAASTSNIVDAMKIGATDFLAKPVTHDDLRKALNQFVDQANECDPIVPRERKSGTARKQTFLGTNPRMKELQGLIGQVAWSEAPVLIQGETGSGKEVLARDVHAQSPRANKPFLKLNCAALPPELVESELFGYERGAFTGAFQRKPGMFEMAEGGTILLDEIGDMDYKLQAKLLQVLQDHEFQRLGGKEVIRVNVRVIAATHCDLEQSIAERTFRADLYYRLNVINLRLPSLRERREDIVPLAEFFLKRHATSDAAAPILTPLLKEALAMHFWPGNIRELENVIRRLVALGDPNGIAMELRHGVSRRAPASRPENASQPAVQEEEAAPGAPILQQVTKAKEQAETDAILSALNSTRWNRKQAATLLKIDYKALLYKMKKLSIEDRVISFSAKPARAANVFSESPVAKTARAGL